MLFRSMIRVAWNDPALIKKAYDVGAVAESARVSPDELSARIDDARARGWDHNFEEWQTGLSVIAAPIIVRERIRGAVALGAASARLQALGGTALSAKVVEVAGVISARLATGRVGHGR
mgnify:CR=1 FL=1